MDPIRIAARVLFAYIFLLTMVRLSGKRAVGHGTPMEIVLALVFGDMVDDFLWAEIGGAQFVAGAGTLFIAQLLTSMAKTGHVVSRFRFRL
jgi:uncharacterized membrane protein YcaP (DUF421 family)